MPLGRQIPAKANSGASGQANQRFTEGVPLTFKSVFLSGSANLVTGTRQRPPMSLPTVTAVGIDLHDVAAILVDQLAIPEPATSLRRGTSPLPRP